MKLGFELLKNTAQSAGYGWTVVDNQANPYGIQQLQIATADVANEGDIKEILSIPSPYARFHITETAILEGTSRNFADLPPVYKRSLAHCLDVFELFYLMNGVKLTDLNIHVNKHKYINTQELDSGNNDIVTYVKALDLFRKNYGEKLFCNFYTITREVNETKYLIASTSPFSIFSTPEDIDKNCEIYVNEPNRILFASEDNENKLWTGIEKRTSEVQKFIYAVAKKYSTEFPDFFAYISKRMDVDLKKLVETESGCYFDKHYSKYQITGKAGVPIAVDKEMSAQVEILPLGYDTFVFENFLNTSNAHDYSIVEKSDSDEYNTSIEERRNIFSNQANPERLNWITIHDLLEDDVFVTTNHIDDQKYLAVVDDNDDEIDAILPFKKKFFELFKMYNQYGRLVETDEIKKWVSLRFVNNEEGHRLYVSLSLPILGQRDGKVTLTKIYDNDHIHKLDIDFGIYPFLQVTRKATHHECDGPDNFYRIMLYLTNDRLENLENDVRLYKRDYTTSLLIPQDIAKNGQKQFHIQRHSTITEENYQGLIRDNLYYISLESWYFIKTQPSVYRDVRFDFVEVTIRGKQCLIVPRFSQQNLVNSHNNVISVDLGTSNTYVAYGTGAAEAHSFEDNNYEQLVGKLCYNSNKECDITQNGLHQATEFIPSTFGRGDNKGSFPVQTIQLFQNTVINSDFLNAKGSYPSGAPFVSMFTLNIPFLYAHKGSRTIGTSEVDSKITNFKWFSIKNGEMIQRNAFELFVDQLCFMMRNKFASNNLDLNCVKLIWTYPLAISGNSILRTFDDVWKYRFMKYFGDTHSQMINTGENESARSKIFRLTESETPIQRAKFADDQIGIKVGIDIGGGTTDVILYEPQMNNIGQTVNTPTLATSFYFAGNMMFGRVSGNGSIMLNQENIWFQVLKNHITSGGANISGDGVNAKLVSIDPNKHNITEFMDYIFAFEMPKDEIRIRQAMDNSALKFISLMHVSALLWETARICKAKLNKRPKNVALSGNGSNLILMSIPDLDKRESAVSQLVNGIFSRVFGQSINDMKVELLKEPKKATAQGALSMVAKNVRVSTASNVNAMLYKNQLYMLHEQDLDISGGAATNSDFNTFQPAPASSDDFSFGDIFATDTAPQPQAEAVVETPTVNLGCPQTSDISNDWTFIADEVGEFLDFFFRLAGSPLGGRIGANGVAAIRDAILGGHTSYQTAKMEEIIDRARTTMENRIRTMSEDLNPDMRVKESIFLATMAHVLAEVIEFFGRKAAN